MRGILHGVYPEPHSTFLGVVRPVEVPQQVARRVEQLFATPAIRAGPLHALSAGGRKRREVIQHRGSVIFRRESVGFIK